MAETAFDLREGGKLLCVKLASGDERCVGISAEVDMTDKLATAMLWNLALSLKGMTNEFPVALPLEVKA